LLAFVTSSVVVTTSDKRLPDLGNPPKTGGATEFGPNP
jgi:hypothetical protein